MKSMPRLVACPDKLRGTASAADAAAAICRAAFDSWWDCDAVPVADGGEGTLDVLGGANRETVVTGPLGEEVRAGWRYGKTAVIEMARASGLLLAGGADGNDPIAASTMGTGELITAAVDAGCRRIIVGVGGSATTDGGLGALRALEPLARLRGVELIVACDVRAAATADGVPVVAVLGEVVGVVELPDGLTVISLVERFGEERARADTLRCIQDAVAAHLTTLDR